MTDREVIEKARDIFMNDPEMYKALVATVQSALNDWLFGDGMPELLLSEFIADRIIGK